MQKPTADDIKLNPDAKHNPSQSEKWALGAGEPFPLGASVEGNYGLFHACTTPFCSRMLA